MAPSFYVRTVTEDTGDLVPDEIIQAIRRVFVNSVPELTAGRFEVAAFEWGTTAGVEDVHVAELVTI
jgi:hypothetical protein